MRRFILLLCLMAAALLPARVTRADTPDVAAWRLLVETPPLPPAIDLPFGVYDPVRHRVLVGGVSGGGGAVIIRVLELTPAPHWSVLSVAGDPPQAYLPALVYDSSRDRLLVFGQDARALNLSGPPTWTVLETSGPGPAKSGHSAVYDAARDRVIVFGGFGGGYPERYLSDAWELSLSTNTWSLLTPTGARPGGREGHGAIYDPIGQRMLVFGGHYEAVGRGFWNDLWELSLGDTPTWTELHPTGGPPGARSAFGTVYDPVRRRILIHGGINSQSSVEPDDLWALSLDGELAWTKIEPANGLRGRSYPVDVYDPVEDRLLACGGGQYPQTSELSLSAPAAWRAVLPVDPVPSPGARTGNAVVHDSRRDRFAALGGRFSVLDSTVWAFDPSASSPWQSLSSLFTPDFDLLQYGDHTQSAAYDSLIDRFLVRDAFGQVWSTPAQGKDVWTNLGPEPPFEDLNFEMLGFEAGLSIDTHARRVLATGGLIAAGHAAWGTTKGVWSLPLTSDPQWTQIGVLPQTYGAAMHASFYDAIRDRLILVGGIWNGGKFQVRRDYGPTVWTTPLDATLQWTDRSTSLGEVPPGPPIAQAAYDPQHDRLFLFADSSVWVRAVDDTGPWKELTFTSPRPLVRGAVANDRVRDQLVALFAQGSGSDAVQAWALTYGPPSATVLESSASSSGITLKWRSPAAIGRAAVLERSERGSAWVDVAPLAFDLYGLAPLTDPGVRLDHAYDYRVRVDIGGTPWRSEAVRVAMLPSLTLAILAGPNPAFGELQVALSLPDASPARLEAYDIQGRLRASRDVGALGAGPHTVVLGEDHALRPGVYLLRLKRGSETRNARITLVR